MPLLEKAFKDKNRDVRSAAIEVLPGLVTQIPEEELWPLLEKAFKEKDLLVRYAAIEALPKVVSHIPEEKRVPLLEKVFKDKDWGFVLLPFVPCLE